MGDDANAWRSNLADLELSADVEVLHHVLELLVGDFSIVVLRGGRGTRSALMMVRSTSCWSCRSVRLLPTIILRTVKSSPLVMKPSSSMS
jgi:hypothetical protein